MDVSTGLITGIAPDSGEYKINIVVKNAVGEDSEGFPDHHRERTGTDPPDGMEQLELLGTER